MSSILTNNGAMVALQSLNRTNSEMEQVQKRISTGFRVADSVDQRRLISVCMIWSWVLIVWALAW